MQEPILLIHGGAGSISDARVPGKLEGMKKAVRFAYPLLLVSPKEKPGSRNLALDAVEAAVRSMELDENFNAGYGSCLNIEGNVEVEASIMEGCYLSAGSVTLLHDIMHPISVARRVMEKTNHTFIGGESAQKFAVSEGFEQLPAGSLVTEDSKAGLATFKERKAKGLDTKFARTELDVSQSIKVSDEKGETVGAVAIDAAGNIAAATSTGGITGKIPGRIGDTPIIGCGTYADNLVGAVSATGHGETIMRFNLAQKILSKISCDNLIAAAAIDDACTEMTERLGGTGGAIAISSKGEIGYGWTSKRMAWAYAKNGELYFGVDKEQEFKENL